MLTHRSCSAAPFIHPYRPDWWDYYPKASFQSLLPGETFWMGPIPEDDSFVASEIAKGDARQAARAGLPVHVRSAGNYLRCRRLRCGRPLKLSDWKDLEVGEAMLLRPSPTADDVARAATTAGYLRMKGVGVFRTVVTEAGQLWVERDSACVPSGRKRRRPTLSTALASTA